MEKVVNIKSPTGCVHRAIVDRFSVEHSRKTVCKHTTPSSGGLGWNHTSYHDWPETDEEVTCKRCLKELEPKTTGVRFDFYWNPIMDGEVSAEVTRNTWYHDIPSHAPDKVETFVLYAGKHHVGMRAPGGIPKMSEETATWLHAIAKARWAALAGENQTFHWEFSG